MSDIHANRDAILRVADRHGASEVRVFGSCARGESAAGSDLDLLVRMAPGRSLLDRIALMHDLEDLLACKVDVVNEKALHPAIRARVMNEVVAL